MPLKKPIKIETQEETMFTKKSKKELHDTWAYGLESCHNCDDESCDDNLNRIEPATNTIHASTIHASTIHAIKPPKINEIDVCRQAIHKHGISRQLAKAAEEFSEAAAAISRFLAGEGEYTEIIGEVADVEVMCVQMRLIYGADAIDQVRAEKIARLHGRLR
jgi:hypothetical protein